MQLLVKFALVAAVAMAATAGGIENRKRLWIGGNDQRDKEKDLYYMCNTHPSNTEEGRRQVRASGTVFLTQNEAADGSSTPGDVEVYAYLRNINTRRRN